MELHQNNSETAESIKESRAVFTHSTLDADAFCSTTVKEVKATCTHTIQEAETLCSTAIRDAETWGASQADSLHWRHAKTIQHLKEQVIQEEGKSQIDFLSACQAALQASPIELRGGLVASYHLLMGQAPMSLPFTLSQGSPHQATICYSSPFFPSAWVFSQAQEATPLPRHQWMTCLLVGPHPRQPQKGPPAPSSEMFYLGTRYSTELLRSVQLVP